jgi:hypothetical protein
MSVWRPQLNPVIGLITFGLYTIVFFLFGAILQSSSDSVVDVEESYSPYNKDCAINGKYSKKFNFIHLLFQLIDLIANIWFDLYRSSIRFRMHSNFHS